VCSSDLTPGTKKPTKIRKPAAIVEMDAGLPTRLFIQPNRNPHTGPKPRVKYTYGPPASGMAAPSSAIVSAPKSESAPPAIHTRKTSPVEPVARAIEP